MIRKIWLVVVCLVLVTTAAVWAGNRTYPQGHIGSLELQQMMGHAYLVDCRSRFEYDLLRMKNAVHVPAGTMMRGDLQRLRDRNPERPIIFYCDGGPCPKSRDAYKKAQRWGFKNVYVYRPGIVEWARERPGAVIFAGAGLGSTLPHSLLADNALASDALPISQFLAVSRQNNALVVDIRDSAERQRFQVSLPNLHHYPLDRLVNYLKNDSRRLAGKKMLILDSCGYQSRWLAFFLARRGQQDFAFLQGGVAAWQQQGFDRYGNKASGTTVP